VTSGKKAIAGNKKPATFWALFMKRSFALCPLRSALKNNNRVHYLAVLL